MSDKVDKQKLRQWLTDSKRHLGWLKQSSTLHMNEFIGGQIYETDKIIARLDAGEFDAKD